MLMSVRFFSSVLMKVMYKLISKINLYMRTSLNTLHIWWMFLGMFCSCATRTDAFWPCFFFPSCQNWAILWSYFGFVEPAVYQHEEPGVLALLHDWHWENQSHDYCQGKTPAGLACRPEISTTCCPKQTLQYPVQMYVLQNHRPAFC